MGSHDITLDVLADLLKAGRTGYTLSSTHVGSLGGLMASSAGAATWPAPTCWTPDTAATTSATSRKYLAGVRCGSCNLVHRDKGLMVRKRQPAAASGIADLTRPDVTFINRQGGSGTRVLLDFRLKQLGVDPAAIPGYETEESTHMAVAVAVVSGARTRAWGSSPPPGRSGSTSSRWSRSATSS